MPLLPSPPDDPKPPLIPPAEPKPLLPNPPLEPSPLDPMPDDMPPSPLEPLDPPNPEPDMFSWANAEVGKSPIAARSPQVR